MITVSAPGKIHLLGEHTVVYGKPALLAAVDLRVTVHLRGEKMPASQRGERLHLVGYTHVRGGANLAKTIEPIVKKHLKIKAIPPYHLSISSQIPIGAGLGSSAAISAAYIAALLSFLKVKWDLDLINDLTFEAEKVFHGNPSGADNTTVVYGGLISYIKGKLVQQLPFSIPPKLAKNFILINTGKPKETTKEMVEMVSEKLASRRSGRKAPPAGRAGKSEKFKEIFDHQEQLVRELLPVIKEGNEEEFIRIIREGEKNLESIGVVSPFAASIIQKIEKIGGAAKICGAGGKTKATGVLLAYHQDKEKLVEVAMSYNLPYYSVTLGTEGLRQES